MMKVLKTFVGILLIPLGFGTARAFYRQISGLSGFSNSFLVMERGVLAYLLFHVLIIRPVYIYVVGHEFMHVIATWLCGGRIESFRVMPSGGSVTTSKTNIFIELSPYFIPIYTLLLGPIFMILRASIFGFINLNFIFLFLIGFTLTFHFVMTTEVLKMRQSDIAKSGIILSLVFIFTLNLVSVMAVFCPLFSGLSFIVFIKSAVVYTAAAYGFVYQHAQGLAHGLIQGVAR
ncbi:MAG: hypothetical protein KJ995_05070 [Candidatus Omnitrophica bacterium]|nr:hypothetical protein [Candidatus Omnitrophota bacterium]MBU1128323.1 hypothetical protein [Candidatus Omnitrophota bacterium]MBU1784583.1 hypothetical protein [Candidatus Omnitrophota bacterium]MBU1851759.1 hypothetical protein [Candidatus Omnitrophota bacterium]